MSRRPLGVEVRTRRADTSNEEGPRDDIASGDTGLRHLTPTCQPVAERARTAGIPAAVANLKQTLRKVHAKAPDAEIILPGYAPVVSSHSAFFTSSYGVPPGPSVAWAEAKRWRAPGRARSQRISATRH